MDTFKLTILTTRQRYASFVVQVPKKHENNSLISEIKKIQPLTIQRELDPRRPFVDFARNVDLNLEVLHRVLGQVDESRLVHLVHVAFRDHAQHVLHRVRLQRVDRLDLDGNFAQLFRLDQERDGFAVVARHNDGLGAAGCWKFD